MDFARLVQKRRMVRHFTAEPVPPDVVERLLRTAQRAPSAGFSQGVSFVVVTDPARRARVAEIAGESWYVRHGHQPFVSQAAVQVVLCTSEQTYRARYREPDKRKPGQQEQTWPVPYWYVDAGCALMLLLLGAVDEGLAAAFVGVRDPAELRDYLGAPETVWPVGVVLLGRGAPDRLSGSLKRGRKPLAEVAHWQRWGGARD